MLRQGGGATAPPNCHNSKDPKSNNSGILKHQKTQCNQKKQNRDGGWGKEKRVVTDEGAMRVAPWRTPNVWPVGRRADPALGVHS